MQIILLDKVEKFLESNLTEKEMAKTIRVIDLLEKFGNKLEMPHSKYLENGILELRIRGKREIRILYCFHKQKIILLHTFIKKSQNTPAKELNRAQEEKSNLH